MAMDLESGQMLSHYRLAEKIGEGGMGVVWKAMDTTLDREVAIKVLPDAFAEDTERLARFEREAKSLAALNHPNIAAIHSFHEAGGTRFLAMELVPGEDLAELTARGAIPVDEALEIAGQIAMALEAAHAAGIVHRDLKPANVRLTPGGKVKVLDFGLAKAWAGPSGAQSDPSMSPTMTSAGTMVGVILGTAAYMSPEQARGRAVDQRSDLWALGVILFEMLTGRQTFPGEDISEVLAGVIKSDPEWDALPPGLPRTARFVLRRCLERKPEERLHSAADLRILLEEARNEPAAVDDAGAGTTIPAHRASWLHWTVLAITIIAALLGMWWMSSGRSTLTTEPVHFRIDPPAGGHYAPSFGGFFDITPDGRTIVFSAVDPEGVRHLYARDLGSLKVEQLAGTRGAEAVFISPNGQIGFAGRSQLHSTQLGGLTSSVICDIADAFYGGSFAQDGAIIFNDDFDSGLKRVAGKGDPVESLTLPDRERGEMRHTTPYALPNGKGVVFTIWRLGTSAGNFQPSETAVLSFESGETSILMSDAYGPYRYLPNGHLLMLRSGRLIAVPFDQERLETTGPPLRFHDDDVSIAEYAASPAGTLVHTETTVLENEGIAWVDRDGVATAIEQKPGTYYIYPTLSPDGKQLAVSQGTQIWIYELEGGRRMRLTTSGLNVISVFSPDGERLLFGSYQPEENLYAMAVDGSGEMELLLDAENRQYPLDWDETNDRILVQWTDPESGYGIRVMPVAGGTAEPLLDSPYNERWAQLSPDGRWLVYASDESGRNEIYVASYPDLRGKRAVSTDGGIEPRWSDRGNEIFFKGAGEGELYRAYTEMWVAPVTLGSGSIEIGAPRKLFEGEYVSGMCCGHTYDVTPDGRRFVMILAKSEADRRLTVELNTLDAIRDPVKP